MTSSRRLIPVAIGHLLSIAVVAGAVLALRVVIDSRPLLLVTGGGLIVCALYRMAYGSRHRARIGMLAGFAGLLTWSFVIASARGAGLMLVPALVPLCLSAGGGGRHNRRWSADHSACRSRRPHGSVGERQRNYPVLVYDWIGIGFLRRGWINLDWLWTGALANTGMIVLAH